MTKSKLTRVNMKIIITTIITALIILSFTGCSKNKYSSECDNSNDPNCNQQKQSEYFSTPLALKDVIDRIPEGSGIIRMKVIEAEDRELTVSFSEPNYQLDQIIENYQSLRQAEFEEVITSSLATIQQLDRDQGIDHSVYINAIETDINVLQTLIQSPVTGDFKIREVFYARR